MSTKKSENTRRKILDTAQRLFSERGYDNVTMKDIARELSITHANLYYYFNNKIDLAGVLFDEGVDVLISFIQKCRTRTEDKFLLVVLFSLLFSERLLKDEAFQTVFLDVYNYADFDQDSLAHSRNTRFYILMEMAEEAGIEDIEDFMNFKILMTDAFMKTIFKAMKNQLLYRDLDQITDSYFELFVLEDFHISRESYLKTKAEAKKWMPEIKEFEKNATT